MTATCHLCGTSFEPHPDSYVERGYRAEAAPGHHDFSTHDLALATDYRLTELGIDRAAADQMLKAKPGDEITVGAAAVCDPCLKQHFNYPP